MNKIAVYAERGWGGEGQRNTGMLLGFGGFFCGVSFCFVLNQCEL